MNRIRITILIVDLCCTFTKVCNAAGSSVLSRADNEIEILLKQCKCELGAYLAAELLPCV